MNSYFNCALNTIKTYFINFIEFVLQQFKQVTHSTGCDVTYDVIAKKCSRVPNWHPVDSDR